jgi:hypothetical protein
MWMRWNDTTHIFEQSFNDGASWAVLPLNATVINEGSLNIARLPANIAVKDANNNFTVGQTFATANFITGANSILYLKDTTSPVDSRVWRFANYGDGLLRIEALNDALSSITTIMSLSRNGDVTHLGKISESGRTPIGYWTDATPTIGGTGSGTATLTTTTSYRYMYIGKTLYITFYLTIQVTGTPQGISILLPSGNKPAVSSAIGVGFPNLYAPNPAFLSGSANDPLIYIFRDINGTNWTAGSHIITGSAIVSLI